LHCQTTSFGTLHNVGTLLSELELLDRQFSRL
jgi:hypothetical protein